MQNSKINILFIGDVVGRIGRAVVAEGIPFLKEKFDIDMVIVNGENSAGGVGIIPKTADQLFKSGADVITTGNHVWDKKEALDLLQEDLPIIRPANYPKHIPGRGYLVYKSSIGVDVAVINLIGRVFMETDYDNPFVEVENILEQLKGINVIFVDFHGEATSEKEAMGFFLDGRVSAVVGTHTHVPTADHRILPNGTAYQTDVGMCGVLNSILGSKKEPIIERFKNGVKERFTSAKGDAILDYAVITIDVQTGKALNINQGRYYQNKE